LLRRRRPAVRAAAVIVLLASALAVHAATVAGVVRHRGAAARDAVVYLERVDGPAPRPAPGHVVMDQKNLAFAPHVLPVVARTTSSRSMRLLRGWSLAAKSGALLGAYAVVLAGVYGAFTTHLLRRETALAHERVQQTAQLVAVELDGQLEAGKQRLATVARLP